MKRRQKMSWFLSGMLAAVLIVNLATPALASAASKVIEVFTGVTIYVDGVEMKPTNAQGNPVETFIYNGTTYVPLRAVSQFLGKNVNWDGANRRVYIGEMPGQKQYLVDVCPPYQTSNYNAPTSITMAGQKYDNGFSLGGYGNGWALFNLNGQYQTMEFDLGHIDGTGMENATVNIYLDGTLAFSEDLEPEMLPTHHSISLSGALQLKIEVIIHYSGVAYGFANVTII